MERESRAISGDKLNDEMFKDLLARIREFSANRRLEAAFKKKKGDPMDVSQIDKDQSAAYQYDYYYQGAEYGQDQDYGRD